MLFQLSFSEEASKQYQDLQKAKNLMAQLKAVTKALKLLSTDPRHPGLQTHAYSSIPGPEGAKVFEAYTQQNTPGAYRIFLCYHPPKTNSIMIIAITPHP